MVEISAAGRGGHVESGRSRAQLANRRAHQSQILLFVASQLGKFPLCNLGALCDSVVVRMTAQGIHHRVTESTEVAQRRFQINRGGRLSSSR
jgi:hypothetical protein